jgi:RNA polymerase sigma-70 factor, ECF subfamily
MRQPRQDTGSYRQRVAPDASPEDDASLRHLHQVYGPALLKFLTRQTRGDIHRAEDIVQETLLRAWRSPESRNADGRWTRAWIYTVAKRILIDQIRAAALRPVELQDVWIEMHARAEDPMDGLIEDLSDAQKVRGALNSLPEHLRVTLVAIYYQGCSTAQAAQLLGIPAGTVKSRTFYALRALREALNAQDFRY